MPGTNYTHIFVEGYVSVAYHVQINGSVSNVIITDSKNKPTRDIKEKSFNGFLETNVISTVSKWQFKPVGKECLFNSNFIYEQAKNA